MQIVESRRLCHDESGRLKMKQDEARLGRCTPRGRRLVVLLSNSVEVKLGSCHLCPSFRTEKHAKGLILLTSTLGPIRCINHVAA